MAASPKVINLRDTGGKVPEGAVRIDRKTKWGNPYPITEGATRENVLTMYWGYIRKQKWIAQDAKKELRGKDLACWCAPEACHGDVLLELANRKES